MYSKLRNRARGTKLALLAAIMLSVIVSPSLPGSAVPAYAVEESSSPSVDAYRIVAIGDSVTAGYELGFTEKSVPYGFVEQVYEQSLFHGNRTEIANYGVIGLKTNGLKRWLEAAAGGSDAVEASDVQEGLPDPRTDQLFAGTKQLRESLAQADLIVMTIGGNDFLTVVRQDGKTEAAAELKTVLENYKTDLLATLRLIHRLNPGAEVVIADQYLPVPTPYKIGNTTIYSFDEDIRQLLLDGVKQIQEILAGSAELLGNEGLKIKIAGIADGFAGNELGFTSIAKGDIHPNRLGYTVIAKAFTNAIWGDYRTVKPRAAGIPLSIIVKGTELSTPNEPLLMKGRTYVALRDIIDGFGAKLDWNAKGQIATIKLQDRTVDIQIGATTIKVNGKTLKLNADPAFIYKKNGAGKTYVPLAALTEGLGFQVVYRDTLKTIFINM
ncbi:stalk domain-containing protein [Paenibacillus harenae]|uniref:Lysophospholipase L1-like esterase n=1 Tax=Paenibacillus harenae TaxID=306543 RepID=A0ABT9UAI0_PAEHA|nr:stalk domain-containing protein [Paenibacillus harenae]MDQ0115209.1 lysophospholipase L1-like esterase [Paenibacillus harenae]